jgi:hypothetical protein
MPVSLLALREWAKPKDLWISELVAVIRNRDLPKIIKEYLTT